MIKITAVMKNTQNWEIQDAVSLGTLGNNSQIYIHLKCTKSIFSS